MNFSQALANLLNGGSIANGDWQRPGASLILQEPIGMVTERFVVQRLANGVCRVYNFTQEDVLGNNWRPVDEVGMPANKALTQGAAHGVREEEAIHA